MNESELKYQGLLERVGPIVSRYENEIAQLRVELTRLSERNDELESLLKEFKEQDV